jgi:hypothetical protein
MRFVIPEPFRAGRRAPSWRRGDNLATGAPTGTVMAVVS